MRRGNMPANVFCLAATLSAFHVGCRDVAGPVTDVEQVPAAGRVGAAVSRPFQGRIAGTIAIVLPFAPGSDDRCNANFSGDPSAPGAAVSVLDESRGTFSHLGSTALHAVSCVDPFSPFSSGHGTLTAANGDRVFIGFANLTVPDASDPSRLLVAGTQWVTGGTGRFAGAHGEQTCQFTIILVSPSSGEIDGWCRGLLVY